MKRLGSNRRSRLVPSGNLVKSIFESDCSTPVGPFLSVPQAGLRLRVRPTFALRPSAEAPITDPAQLLPMNEYSAGCQRPPRGLVRQESSS